MQDNRTILVVDDSADIHRVLRARLVKEQWETDSATSGAECLEKASANPPALILLDIDMPVMDGFETLRALKASPRTAATPVIVLSGSMEVADKVTGLDLGAVDYVGKPFDFYELVARVRAALRTQRLMEMLATRAQIDGLTGLWNRACFDARLAERLVEAERHERPLSLALGDIDKFKSINDSYGHPAGDTVLQGFAELMQRELRSIDAAFRFGGEEFAVIMPETDAAEARAALDRVRSRLSEARWPRHPERKVTVSFGVATRDGVASWDPSAWVEAADKALYRSKSGGRDRVTIAGERVAAAAAA